jgi:hypothetical protein
LLIIFFDLLIALLSAFAALLTTLTTLFVR